MHTKHFGSTYEKFITDTLKRWMDIVSQVFQSGSQFSLVHWFKIKRKLKRTSTEPVTHPNYFDQYMTLEKDISKKASIARANRGSYSESYQVLRFKMSSAKRLWKLHSEKSVCKSSLRFKKDLTQRCAKFTYRCVKSTHQCIIFKQNQVYKINISRMLKWLCILLIYTLIILSVDERRKFGTLLRMTTQIEKSCLNSAISSLSQNHARSLKFSKIFQSV